jgi:hypothetical protein
MKEKKKKKSEKKKEEKIDCETCGFKVPKRLYCGGVGKGSNPCPFLIIEL